MPQLTPTPKFAVRTDTGDPAVGWKLWTYLENTSTPKDTYADFGKVGTNQNPIILDSRGEAEIWLDGSYKFVLTDDLDQTIWTIDNIRDQTQNQTLTNATLAGTLTVSSTSVTWSGNPTHSGNHTFGGNVTVNGNTQLGNASSDTLRVDSNTITWTNNPTHSGNHVFSGTLDVIGLSTLSALTLGFSLATGIGGPTTEAIKASTFTQNLFNGVNVASFTTFEAMYLQIGKLVVLTLLADLALTAGTTTTSFELDMPIVSDFTLSEDAIGAFNCGGVGARVFAETTNNRIKIAFTSNAAGTAGISTGMVVYRIK